MYQRQTEQLYRGDNLDVHIMVHNGRRSTLPHREVPGDSHCGTKPEA